MKNDISLSETLTALGDWFAPRTCVACGRVLGRRERLLCIYCRADLPYSRYWERPRQPMADRYNAGIQRHLTQWEPYAFAVALFLYHSEAGYKHIPQALKYEGNFAVGKHFGRMLGRRIAGCPFLSDVDLVVPVPLHPLRQWRRGYNQAAVIADAISSITGIPVERHLLRRFRRTRSQVRLSVEEKARNVTSAFRISRRGKQRYGDRTGGASRPRHILLVDDVFTTGATLCACHAALRQVFPPSVRISAATLAVVHR